MSTFAELGLPFPLYRAPVSESPEYLASARCVACGEDGRHRFDLGIGAELVLACPACGVENALDADDRAAKPCSACSAPVPFPPVPSGVSVAVCHSCLRAGKASITHDTPFGMVSWEQAHDGWTHGVPGPIDGEGVAVRPSPDDEEWIQAHVGSEYLLDLVRTPGFSTWQGATWLFCCKRPSVYLGEWDQAAFARHDAADGGLDAFMNLVDEADADTWDAVGEGALGGPYMFQCPQCDRLQGYYDFD